MISVVMATYNSEKYILKQIDSIRLQTVPVDEVIFVDDCSEDRTVEVLVKYIAKYNLNNWRIYRHFKNEGFIKSFSDALSIAIGKIIILCDHDDIWFPNKVEIIRDQFIKNPEILSINTSFIKIDSNDKPIKVNYKLNTGNNNLIRRKIKNGKLNKMNLYDVAVYNISPGCTCAISNKLKIDYFKEYGILPHDWQLNILAACQDGLFYLDIPTTKYRIYEKNTIGLHHENNYVKRKIIANKNFEEKKAAFNIICNYYGKNSPESKYFLNIKKAFYKRKVFLESQKISDLFKLLKYFFFYRGFFENILMDCVSILRSNGIQDVK